MLLLQKLLKKDIDSLMTSDSIFEFRVIYVIENNGDFMILLAQVDNEKFVFPISVGLFEANSIIMAIDRIPAERPFTHDLFVNILKGSQLDVEKLVITDICNDVFIGRLYIRNHNDIVDYDVRPSDGIAIVLRTGSPIYVSQKVLTALNLDTEVLANKSENETPIHRGNFLSEEERHSYLVEILQQTKKNLEDAVSEERYEEAADFRDTINKIKKQLVHDYK